MILTDYIYHQSEKSKSREMDLPFLKNDIIKNFEALIFTFLLQNIVALFESAGMNRWGKYRPLQVGVPFLSNDGKGDPWGSPSNSQMNLAAGYCGHMI